MEFGVKLEKDDWLLFQKHIEKKSYSRLKDVTFGFWFNMLLWCVIAIVLFIIFQFIGELHWPSVIVTSGIFLAIFVFWFIQMQRVRLSMSPMDDGAFCTKTNFLINDKGIYSTSEKGTGFSSWSAVKEIEHVNGQLLVFIDNLYAYIFPDKKIENPGSLYEYIIEKNKCNKSIQPTAEASAD